MKFDYLTVLKALEAAASLIPAAPLLIVAFEEIIATFSDDVQQADLKEALADLITENAEGHARLQEKLAAAALK